MNFYLDNLFLPTLQQSDGLQQSLLFPMRRQKSEHIVLKGQQTGPDLRFIKTNHSKEQLWSAIG